MSLYLIIIIALLLSAFFSGMEIAFISSNRLKIELEKKHWHFSSKIISIFTLKPGYYIATLLIGNNIALVVYGIAMAILMEPFLRYNLHISNDITILTIQTVVSTLIILMTGEFLPKTIFRARPNLTLNLFSFPVFIFYVLLYPITVITLWITDVILRFVFRMNVNVIRNNKKPVFGMVDIDHLVNETSLTNTNFSEEKPEIKIFQNTLLFSRLKVRDCMIPRTDITALEINSPLETLREKAAETGYSKILVYEESIDNIVGYVKSKDLFKQPQSIKAIQTPLSIVPDSMYAKNLFRKLIKERKSIALVVDEYGGTSGIITLEDIMEEIFGEIEDEHDTQEFLEKQTNENEFIFSARIEIDYINEKYNLGIPENEEYDTLAGFIIYHYESIPEPNTTLTVGVFEIRVLKVSSTRIELIRLKKNPLT